MRGHVLIADADELLVAAYRAFLVAEGFQVMAVNNALDCLEALRESPPLALVLDPDLPWGSGTGVLALMREGVEIPAVPVLILASSPTCLTDAVLPFADYAVLFKPVKPSTVAAVVRTLVDAPAVFCAAG